MLTRRKTIVALAACVLVGLILILQFKGEQEDRVAPTPPESTPVSSKTVPDPAVAPYAMTSVALDSGEAYCPAFAVAILEGDRQQVLRFLENGADMGKRMPYLGPGGQSRDYPPCLLAAIAVAEDRADCDFIRFLVEHGADVNDSTDVGVTPLHLAATTENVELAETLLELGANVNVRCDQGRTALRRTRGRAPLVGELLIRHGGTE